MSDRDDLADIIAREHFDSGGDPSVTAGDIIAAGFHRDRTITTAEEALELPEGAIIVDSNNVLGKMTVWEDIHNFHTPLDATVTKRQIHTYASELAYPLTVLWEPEADDE